MTGPLHPELRAALMSALTLGSTMGILTWMFVEGHGSGLMNYTPQPLMAPMIGLIIAVIWGLSTDYEVFLVSRMVEARQRGMSTAEAMRPVASLRCAIRSKYAVPTDTSVVRAPLPPDGLSANAKVNWRDLMLLNPSPPSLHRHYPASTLL